MLRFRRFLRVLRTTVNPLLDFVLVTWQLVELLHRHGVLWLARLADKRGAPSNCRPTAPGVARALCLTSRNEGNIALTMFPFIPPNPASKDPSTECIVPSSLHNRARPNSPLKFLLRNCQTSASTRIPRVDRSSMQIPRSINTYQTLGVIRDCSQTTLVPQYQFDRQAKIRIRRDARGTQRTLKSRREQILGNISSSPARQPLPASTSTNSTAPANHPQPSQFI